MSRQDRESFLTYGCSEVVEFFDLRVLRTLEFFPRVANVFDNSVNIKMFRGFEV